jgi:adenylosuccinate lyase
MGRDAAHRLVYDLSIAARADGRTLLEAVRTDRAIAALLDSAAIDAVLDVASHTGQCAGMVDRVLAIEP